MEVNGLTLFSFLLIYQCGSTCLCLTICCNHAEGMTNCVYMVCMHMCVFSCVKAHTCVWVWVHVYVCACVCGGSWLMSGSSPVAFHLIHCIGISQLNPELSDAASLIIQLALGIPVSPSTAGDADGCHSHLTFGGSPCRFSCLCCKHVNG